MQLQKGDLLNKMIKEIKKVYKIVNDIELILKVYVPKDWRWEDRRPAIVFFFGGGWENGTIDHFKTQSQYLAARGMVGITPDYRVGSRHGVTPFECVKDGKAALEWVKENAGELGIDAGKIVVGGGSAGGHIAACMAVLKNSDMEVELRMEGSLTLWLIRLKKDMDIKRSVHVTGKFLHYIMSRKDCLRQSYFMEHMIKWCRLITQERFKRQCKMLEIPVRLFLMKEKGMVFLMSIMINGHILTP